jgi:hypothetical protein
VIQTHPLLFGDFPCCLVTSVLASAVLLVALLMPTSRLRLRYCFHSCPGESDLFPGWFQASRAEAGVGGGGGEDDELAAAIRASMAEFQPPPKPVSPVGSPTGGPVSVAAPKVRVQPAFGRRESCDLWRV